MTEHLPEDITLNLDTVEREKGTFTEKPFSTLIAGRRVVMTDPSEIDWQDLLEIENPVDFLRHCVSQEDRIHISKQKMPGWKFNKLIEAYTQHYGLDLRGNGRGSRI